MTRARDIRKKSDSELAKQLAALRSQAQDLRFRGAAKELKNSHQLREVRKDIARIVTILGEKGQKA